MPRRELLSPAQRLRLGGLPVDIDDRIMARHHTLSDEELAAARKRGSSASRLGFAVQTALLKFPGRPLRAKEAAPEKIVRYVASQLGEDRRRAIHTTSPSHHSKRTWTPWSTSSSRSSAATASSSARL